MAQSQKQRLRHLVKAFGGFIGNVQAARIEMGRIAKEITDITGSRAEASRILTDAYPHAKDRLGYKLTSDRLGEFITIFETFSEGGGIASPDGRHHIDGSTVEHLGLGATDLAKVAEAIASGDLKVKKLKKYAAMALAGNVAEAQTELKKELEPPEPTLDEQLTAARNEVTNAEKAVKRAQERVRNAKAKLAELEASMQAIEPQFPTSEDAAEDEVPAEDASTVIPPSPEPAAAGAPA